MQTEEIVITRIFNAPREQVWKTWTEPSLMKLWWGPKDFTAPSIENDFRTGGKFLFAMKSPDGKVYWSTGTYKDIVPLEKIVTTDSFSDDKGNIVPAIDYGMPPEMPDELEVTVTFEDQGDKTKMILRHKGLPEGKVKEMTFSGWNESLDKFVAVVEEKKRPDLSDQLF